MNTIVDSIDPNLIDTEILTRYAKLILSGELVAFPTETVYGLGANALDSTAVKKIFAVKNRPANNPLIAHINGIDMLERLVLEINSELETLFNNFWPGALTVVMKKRSIVPDCVTAGGDTVAVRCPSHPIASELISLSNTPIVAPSANLSGMPSPTCFEHVKSDLSGKVAGIIDGGECDFGIESTVVIPIGKKALRILRPGVITPEMLNDKGFETVIDKNVLTPVASGEKVASPGMLFKHYAPNAAMEIVRGEDAKVIDYINEKIKESGKPCGVLCFNGEENLFPNATAIEYGTPDDPITLSKNLFRALREFNETDVKMIYARVIPPTGVGLGIYNRMLRAASFNVTAL